ncbi:permease [Maritalea porphyrae]|uniref:permease n=1 Tax=Maritalea porphyrae TaxID=880732 RepID=UPI0022AE7061|nr:permease [Maritalea porphyrae]MCZ4273627.1 permease [Maritalea porphyrae]
MSDITQGQKLRPKYKLSKIIKSVPFAIAMLLVGVALLDFAQLPAIVQFAIRAFMGTLPFILFAVLMIGYLKATGSESMIGRAFAGREIQAIFLAALIGGLAPFCSCEVIPFIAGLLAVGAPLSAVMAFWLASPLIDPPTFIITVSELGWEFALSRAVFAVSLGLMGGFVIKMIGRRGAIADPLREDYKASTCGANRFKGKPKWAFWTEQERVQVFRKEGITNLLFLGQWLALAYVIEALFVTYVPAELVAQVLGGEGIRTIGLAALVGAPAYLNGYAAIPLIAGLLDQGMSQGAAMAFMIAGPVTSIPAMMAVMSLVKKQVFAAYLMFAIVGAVLFGLVFQYANGFVG